MTTAVPRAALKAIFAQLANIPPSYVVWKHDIEPAFGKPASSYVISSASNASPVVVGIANTAALTPNVPVIVSGVLGNAGANGTFPAAIVDGTHVSLTGSTGTGGYTSGGTLTLATPYRWGWLRVSPMRRSAKGWDDLRRTDNGDGTFTMNSVGRRVLGLALDFFSLDSNATVDADDVLEDVRTKLWHPDTLDAFNQVSMVVQDVGDIIDLPTSINGVERSAAHLEITMAIATSDSAKYPIVSGGWVREAAGTGTITTEKGTVINPTIDVVGGT